MKINEKNIKLKNKNFTFRLLQKNDIDMLIKYFSDLSDRSKKWYNPHGLNSFNSDKIREICEKKNKFYKRLIILNENKIIGYCVLYMKKRKWEKYRYKNKFNKKRVCNVAPSILDDYQRIGLGTLLMDYAVFISKKYKKNMIVLLGGVVKNNQKAIKYYKKYGFKQYGKEWIHPIHKTKVYDMYLEI